MCHIKNKLEQLELEQTLTNQSYKKQKFNKIRHYQIVCAKTPNL